MESGLLRQITLTLSVSTLTLSSGMCTGWLTPMTPKLLRFDSPVGRTTNQQITHLSSLPLYVGFFVSFVYGFIGKKFGRKDALMCAAIPSFVSGLLLAFGRSKITLYVGRSFAGCTMVGGVMASFMYVSETVSDSVRGMLLALLAFQINVGILLSYVLGDTLSYEAFNFIGIAVPVVSSILILWLPESPHFLVDNGRIKDAMRSLLWLREGDHIAAKSELESIKPDRNARRPITILQSLKYEGSRTALVVSLLVCILQGMSGIHATLNYAEIIFKDASSPMSPGSFTYTIDLLILVSTFVGVFLIDTTGRKTLLYLSFVGGCVSLAALSFFLYIKLKGADVTNFGWIPISSVSASIVCSSAGLTMVPEVLTNELPSPNLKPLVSSLASALATAIAILTIKSLPILEDKVGLYFIFAISSGFNFLGIFYTWFMVPETRGKSLKRIDRELSGVQVFTAGETI